MSEDEIPGGAAVQGQAWEGDHDAVEAVKSLFLTLGKTFRAYQLYDRNNPVRKRFIDQLKGEFLGLWEDHDRLAVRVDEDRMYLGESEVYQSDNRNDSLAFLFFKDGVREITFLPGIESEELDGFLAVLQRARKLVPEGDDLLTVLWEEDLRFFQYQYVDLLAEGVSLPEAGPGNAPAELKWALQAEEGELTKQVERAGTGAAEDQPQPPTVNQQDFNPTLYAFDRREMDRLQGELKKELERDTRADVLDALFDRLEEPTNRERQSTILRVLATLLPNFLSRGALVPATAVLQELRRLEVTAGVFDDRRIAESRGILDRISAPEAIQELMQSLFDGTVRVSSSQLADFLQFLRGGALSPLLKASETVEHKELQAALRKATQGIAKENRTAVVRLLGEDDPIIAAGAARLAGDLQIAEAGPAMTRLFGHGDPDVRLAAVEAAATLRASSVAAALVKTLEDPERKLRIAAAKALGALQYRPASKALTGIVRGRAIRRADISEKVAVFEAFGVVADANGLKVLDALLNGRGFLGRREPSDIRAAAALALGRIAGPEARAVLEKATQDDDPVVRSNVKRALRHED